MYAINSLMGSVMAIALAIFVAIALSAFNLPELVSLLVFAPAVFAFTA